MPCAPTDKIPRNMAPIRPPSCSQDALEAAHQKDRAGKAADAIKTYRIGSQIIDEGLQLEVPSVGLGPAFSNTARWRADLTTWKLQAAHRCAAQCCARVFCLAVHMYTTMFTHSLAHNIHCRLLQSFVLCNAIRMAQLETGCAPPAPATSIPSSTEAEGWAALRKARPHQAQQQPQPQQPAASRQQSARTPAPHAGEAQHADMCRKSACLSRFASCICVPSTAAHINILIKLGMCCRRHMRSSGTSRGKGSVQHEQPGAQGRGGGGAAAGRGPGGGAAAGQQRAVARRRRPRLRQAGAD